MIGNHREHVDWALSLSGKLEDIFGSAKSYHYDHYKQCGDKIVCETSNYYVRCQETHWLKKKSIFFREWRWVWEVLPKESCGDMFFSDGGFHVYIDKNQPLGNLWVYKDNYEKSIIVPHPLLFSEIIEEVQNTFNPPDMSVCQQNTIDEPKEIELCEPIESRFNILDFRNG